MPRQLMSRCPACFTNFRAFLCDMTCHPNNSDFLLITQDKPYTPPSPTQSVATSINNHVELDNVELEDEQEHEQSLNSRRKRRSIVEEKVVMPSSRDPVTPPTPTEEVVRLTYYLTNYYASNLFNSCK